MRSSCKRRWVSAALGMAAALGAAGAARADDGGALLEKPRHRQGYFVGVGYHYASNYNREKGEGLGLWSGTALTIRIGQLVTRRFGLGLYIDSGGAKRGVEQSGLTGLGIAAQWELAPEVVPNLTLHGGMGLGVASIKDTSDPKADLRGAFGTSYALGLGYDVFLTRHRLTGGWALNPMVQARFIPGENVKSLFVLAGAEICWWSGLPKNQLEISGPDAYKKE